MSRVWSEAVKREGGEQRRQSQVEGGWAAVLGGLGRWPTPGGKDEPPGASAVVGGCPVDGQNLAS
jgi:hypothetical protein